MTACRGPGKVLLLLLHDFLDVQLHDHVGCRWSNITYVACPALPWNRPLGGSCKGSSSWTPAPLPGWRGAKLADRASRFRRSSRSPPVWGFSGKSPDPPRTQLLERGLPTRLAAPRRRSDWRSSAGSQPSLSGPWLCSWAPSPCSGWPTASPPYSRLPRLRRRGSHRAPAGFRSWSPTCRAARRGRGGRAWSGAPWWETSGPSGWNREGSWWGGVSAQAGACCRRWGWTLSAHPQIIKLHFETSIYPHLHN